jgi:hypothetical protein
MDRPPLSLTAPLRWCSFSNSWGAVYQEFKSDDYDFTVSFIDIGFITAKGMNRLDKMKI